LSILAVDDDALVLLNIAAMLEDMGHEVMTASSGAEALRLLGRPDNRFDLVITDHGMPGMTGLQLIDRVRIDRPGLRSIIATGYAELPPGAEREYIRLAKPFFQRHLGEAIETAMAAERA
jgi:CheY-like chemotaxis protein